MDDKTTASIVTIATAILGIAIIAVLVSKSANTSNVIKSSTSGFASVISAAISPVASGSGLSTGLNNSIMPTI